MEASNNNADDVLLDTEECYSRYNFKFDPKNVKRMEHSLVYQAIQGDAVDLIEIYSTDANIQKFNLRVLKDDRGYFPLYEAVWVARETFVENHRMEWESLLR